MTIAEAFARAYVAAAQHNFRAHERLLTSPANGSRPPGLQGHEMVRVWRHGRLLGDYKASKFNWDLWCDYSVLSSKGNKE